MSKIISILAVGSPQGKPDVRNVQPLDGIVKIHNPQNNLWTISFNFKSSDVAIHTVTLVDKVGGVGLTEDNWEEQLAEAIKSDGVGDDEKSMRIIRGKSTFEVITSLGSIDFKINPIGDNNDIFITTMKRTDDIINPIVPNGISLFKNGHYHDPEPLQFLFTTDGIEVRRKGHDNQVTIYKGRFSQSLSGWSRVAEYLGVGNLQDYKFSLSYSDSENPLVLQGRQLGEFSYIESRNGMIAFTRMENPIEKLFLEIKRSITFSHISDHLKETLDGYAKNLVLNHTVSLLRSRQALNNPDGAAIMDLLRFRTHIDELHQLIHKFTSLGSDRFAPNQTRY